MPLGCCVAAVSSGRDPFVVIPSDGATTLPRAARKGVRRALNRPPG